MQELLRFQMELTKVKSSMLKAVGYDVQRHLLEIVFKDGEVYHFQDVPISEYKALMSSDSKGSYMHTNILHTFSNHEVRSENCPDCRR